MSRAPDIIFITTDQHRYDSVGFNGNATVQTPALDALAADAVVLEHCYAPTSVCAPCRASLMTGRYPTLHGQLSNGFTMRAAERFWWDHLREAGYRTVGVGKMHVEPWDDPLRWEVNVRIEGKDWLTAEDEYVRFLRQHGHSFNRPRQAPGVATLPWCVPRLSPVPTEQHIDTYIGARAVAEIEAAGADPRPLATWISFCSPHHPIDPPAEYAERYTDAPVPEHVFNPDERDTKPPEQACMYMWPRINEEIRQQAWRYYYATITLVDDQVARIVRALEATGRLENSVIVFTADHGEMLFQHGLFDKAFAFYDDVYRVPTFVRWPQRLAPGRYSGLVELVDVVPLLLEAGGCAPGVELSGRALPAMLSGAAAPRDSILGQHFHMRMLRTADAKLVNYMGRDYGELYDLRADPLEQRNLYGAPGAAAMQAMLSKQLLDRLTDAVDPAFRELPEPTNKGAYGDYLSNWEDLPLRYLKR